MKKLLLLGLLIFTSTVSAQKRWGNDFDNHYEFFSISIDPAMALYGSDKNSPGLDLVVKLGVRAHAVEVGLFYERFELIKYQSYGVQTSYVFDASNIFYSLDENTMDFMWGGEVSMINRFGPTSLSYGFNTEIVIHIQRLFLTAKADLKRRTDIAQKWGYSNYIGIGYKF